MARAAYGGVMTIISRRSISNQMMQVKICLPRLAKIVAVFWMVCAGFSFSTQAIATTGCIFQGSVAGNAWSYAHQNPIGPSAVQLLAQRFQPVGTILFDQTYPMPALLGNNPDAVLIKCATEADAALTGAALRLDDTYQFGGFIYNGIRYYYTGVTGGSQQHTPVGWKLYGVMPDGDEKELIFNDNGGAGNIAVRFMPLRYKSCTEHGTLSPAQCALYPYVITAADFPSVRLVLARSPYDNFVGGSAEKWIGRIGYILNGISTQADYGFIALSSEYKQNASAACGITQVPRTVYLGTHGISTVVARNEVPWTSFDVTYECSTANSPVDSLRIGFEPQNRSRLYTDPRYLRPDEPLMDGVGIVYRRMGETGARNWIQNSGCMGISTDTENHSNCSMARSQSQDQGWYKADFNTSGPAPTGGYRQYTEPFEARFEPLPGNPFPLYGGDFSATVNVLVNQP